MYMQGLILCELTVHGQDEWGLFSD